MASPTVAARTTGTSNAVPLGTPVAGELIAVLVGYNLGAPPPYIDKGISGDKWHEAFGSATSSRGLGVVWKVADGGDALTLYASAGVAFRTVAYRINIPHGSAVAISAVTGATGANGDPPSVSISGAAQDALAIAAIVMGAVGTPTAPAGYGSLQSAGVGTILLHTAEKAVTGVTSEDPGAFTSASTQHNVVSVLIASTAITTNARQTQEVAETLSQVSPNATLTQLVAEVVSTNALNAKLTQLVVEMVSENVPDDSGDTNKYRQLQIAC